MKYLYIFILLLLNFPCAGADFNYVPPAHGIAGYIVIDLRTGKIITSDNADIALVPASTLKCVTTGVALLNNSPNFRFTTKVLGTGKFHNDSLMGNMIVLPSGDPDLNIDFAQKIAQKIRYVDGAVSVRATEAFPLPTYMIEDIGTDYGVGWSTFNYSNNTMLVNDFMYPLPVSILSDEFISDLKINGIEIAGQSCDHADSLATPILEHYSRPLKEIARELMFKSENLAAESVGRSLISDRNLSDALRTLKNSLSALDIDTCSMRLVDFSGLSRVNLISPRALSSVLNVMKDNRDYIACFPKVGRQGTVKRFLTKTPLEGKLALKSGSMSGVLAYAGYYIGSDNRPTHSVVIIVNNALCAQSEVKHSIERWLLRIF